MRPKVLVVDDTKNIRTLLTTCLEVEGYEVRTACDGQQALALAAAEAFQWIFLDIKLPELSGTEVLRRLRGQGIATPVIIMTAFATVKNAVDCTRLGAVAYLQKPFTAAKIRHVLAELAQEAPAGPEPAPPPPESAAACLAAARRLLAEGNPDEAYAQLKKALALDPSDGAVYALIGRVHEARGELEEARRFYRIAAEFQG
jgi:CheY-like chemotaxis protein